MGTLLLLVAAATSGAAAPSGPAAPRSVLRAQYAYAWGHKIDCAKLKEELVASHTTSHSFLLEDSDGSSYLSFVECLNQTTGFAVDGVPFTAWVTLIPPAEGALGSCSTPADSPLTSFDELSLFNRSLGPGGCYDYRAWAEVTGRLSAQFTQLRFMNVDDFSDADNMKYFSPDSTRRMVELLRPNARLVPTLVRPDSPSFARGTTRGAPPSLAATPRPSRPPGVSHHRSPHPAAHRLTARAGLRSTTAIVRRSWSGTSRWTGRCSTSATRRRGLGRAP